MTSQAPLTFFITGASAGMGQALAHAAAARGDNVVALARNVAALDPLVEEHGDRVLALAADVRRQADVDDAVAKAVARFGRIDVVHNNAGYGVFGAVEEGTDEEARGIFDTNVFGVLNVLRATLPVLRSQRSGHIVQGSSWYGRATHAGVGLLTATKYAVEGLSESLAAEVAPLGIKVTMLEPSATQSEFVARLQFSETIGDYDQTVRKVLEELGAARPEAFNSSEAVATAILAAVDAEHPPLRLITGSAGMNAIRANLQSQLDEIEEWRAVTEAVDGSGVEVAV